MLSLIHMDLVILDELGYLPFTQASGAFFFHLLSKIYERSSVIIAQGAKHHHSLVDLSTDA